MTTSRAAVLFTAFLGVFSAVFLGCKPPALISGVAFKVEPNIETAKAQLNFGEEVQSDLGGSFPIKDYGVLEVQPWTPTTPFNVGFRVNLAIVNDQDYVQLDPVSTLPSGQPLPFIINRALAQVKLKNEINSKFDIYAYVDVVGKEWVGVAVSLKFVGSKYFPAGLSISQNFLKDQTGLARAAASIFGPKVDSNGRMTAPGGIALFANVASLLRGKAIEGFDPGDKVFFFEGPLAPYYRKRPKDASAVADALRVLLNANSRGGQLM